MNRQAKSAIKSLVLTLRRRLEDDIAIKLKRYGFAGERWLPLERLPHVQRDDQATIDHFRLKAALEQHLRRIGAEPVKATSQQQAEAVDWFVREVAFTHLNRLVALKCLEVRDLIPEIITARDAYGGRSRAHYDYRNAHPDEAREADDALPATIRHVCRQVYAEFKFLFDVGDPATGRQPPAHSILWPSYPVLKECIQLINDLDRDAGHDTEHAARNTLWDEDEIIGWIYQFYNAEQKEAIRKRGRPRCPAEVAVINQFFTPRWIVKFLVDNTLGRLWLEMHPDSERVRAKCDYLVPEPLQQGSESASQRGDFANSQTRRFALDPDSPINDPKAPPRREPKRPQDIRLIDPACGTMHFGHYAFEVFQEIYRDALEHGWLDDSPSPDDRERGPGGEGDIPAAILRHNLYGVDIDLRAVQLAGLSLFIKAKTANPDAHISHVNLVVADAVLPPDGARQRFLDQYKDDKVVQNAVRQVLDEMANVAEVGSLLRVEERLQDILAKAGHAAVQDRSTGSRQVWDAERQQGLPGFEPPTRQLSLAEAAGAVPEEWGAHYTLARLLDDLRAFAAEALQTHDLNAQLFAEEVEKSVHLLDVFLNDYDVVVMNPPYGVATGVAKRYLKRVYPRSWNDLGTAFVERATDLSAKGYAGALTSRTYMFLIRLLKFREGVILPKLRLVAMADLGREVLDDAMVETAAYIAGSKSSTVTKSTLFFRLVDVEGDKKQQHLEKGLRNITARSDEVAAFAMKQERFAEIPGMTFAYWAPESVFDLFELFPPFGPAFGDVRPGLTTRDNKRFLREWWEVCQDSIGLGKTWVPFAKGGGYSPLYYDSDLLLLWENDGSELREFITSMGDPETKFIANQEYYFREGLTYPRVTDKGFNVRYLPAGYIFAEKGISIFFEDPSLIWPSLAWLNSAAVQYLLLLMTASRSWEKSHVSSLPFPLVERGAELGGLGRQAYDLKRAWDDCNETSKGFDAPWLIQAHRGTLLTDTATDLNLPNLPISQSTNLLTLLDYVRAVERAADARLQELQTQIDETVYDLYEISLEDRALIERELGDRPPELVWPQMEGKSDKEKRREHVRRLVSYFLLQALKEKRDGILPLTPGTGQATALDEVRRRMEVEFGEAAAFRMETEIKQVLGQSIADWLDGPFSQWHVKLYKRRPVIWHLASPRNLFGCFVYIHKLDRDTLRKVQTLYLWPRRRAAEAELETARAAKASRRIEQAEGILDDLAEFEKRLLAVIHAQVECEIPDWAEGPFRDGVYDPVLDDGVKVNITPLQEAEVLRHRKVV
jgi:hypothetical protein